MKNQKGQVVLILILVMTVALAIGLSIVQRSLVDVSTASKIEQSSRAFSAAEAGIEKALRGDITPQDFTDTNSSIKQIEGVELLPSIPTDGSRQIPLEYPPLAKEDTAQVWLADPNANLPNCNATDICYNPNSGTLDVYWGNSPTDIAALELTLIYHEKGVYKSRKWYLDNSLRFPASGFDTVACGAGKAVSAGYQCYKTLGDGNGLNNNPLPGPGGLMLLRARLLYNATSQPLAVQAVGTCSSCYLPPQARSIISTGVAGETERKIKLFQLYKVVPQYFDYALFSAGEINK